MRTLLITLLLSFMLVTMVFADGTQPPGLGNLDDPYLVSTLDHLIWISTNSGSWRDHFKQTANIDAGNTAALNPNGIGVPLGFYPIGNSTTPFSGTYDGQGFRISNLYINRTETNNIGLFGYVDGILASVQNLVVKDAYVAGVENVGALAGYAAGSTEITNCSSSGDVHGDYNCGGLVGTVGASATVTNCASAADITGSYNKMGGLVGSNDGVINTSYAKGDVSGNSRLGGLAGYSGGTINNCYAVEGSVSGLTYIGGLLGRNIGGTVNYCFAACSVSGNSDLGGLAGDNDATINKCYYDSQVSGQSDAGKGAPQKTIMMKTYSTFYYGSGWDFEYETRNGTASIWDMDFSGGTNSGYPYLAWQDGSSISLPNGPAQPEGSGTSSAPYQIETLEDLIWIARNPNKWSSNVYYIQTANIDASGAISWNGVGGFPSIGKSSTDFEGSYNGQYFTISDVYMRYPDWDDVGVFGKTNCANIRRLGVVNANITGNDNVGAVIGNGSGDHALYLGTISNCYSTGVVKGGNNVGGVVGVTNLYFETSNCYSYADVSGDGYIGGLIGANRGPVFTSFARGDVDGSYLVGGLVGYTSDDIRNSYATSPVSGGNSVGGLIGRFGGGTISRCYAAGSVSGTTDVGGFIGDKIGTNMYSCFYDSDVTGMTDDTKGNPRTTAEMKDFITFYNSGWDYVSETTNGSNDYWDQDCSASINNGYPYLSFQDGSSVNLTLLPEAPASGDGSSGDPYQIATLSNLYWLSLNSSEWGKYFIQTVDVNASGTSTIDCGAGFPPIGNATTMFSGSYNGQEHTIDGLTINRNGESYVGLFGYTDNATIQNLGVTSCNIQGSTYVGGIAGRNNNSSQISRCYTSGSIEGSQETGGIVGRNNTDAIIIDCYSMASVKGALTSGGVAGTNYSGSEIIRCYARGSVTGTTDAGGLVGINNATVINCFYDLQTTGKIDSDRGTPYPTVVMHMLDTFFQAGWDLEVETTNGSANIWDMDHTGTTGGGYPYLSWQDGSSVSIPSKPASGDGSAGDPYRITSLSDLTWLSLFSEQWSTSCIQTSDIDVSTASSWFDGLGFSPIGNATTQFTGSYDGQGNLISNLTINRVVFNYVGLFGYIDGATIKNLGLKNSDIKGGQYVGGIAGRNSNSALIECCYTAGSIEGTSDTGGIAGRNNTNAIIRNCYSKADITGANASGGLLGSNNSDSEVVYCYSIGAISAGIGTGGLIGVNNASVSHSFYNLETTGQSDTGKGIGISTVLMQRLETFTTVGWDFEIESGNGTNDYWDMDCSCSINNGFPFLSWLNDGDTALPVELAAFTARNENKHILLDWTTATESANLGFILERRDENSNWQEIASYKMSESLRGQGTSATETEYSFTDNAITPGNTYTYRLWDVNTNGEVNELATVTVDVVYIPTTTQLLPAYPNPFNPATTIRYELAKNGYVNIAVYDVLGKQVIGLFDGEQSVGSYELRWNGLDERGTQVSSGIFFVRMQSVQQSSIQKITLMK